MANTELDIRHVDENHVNSTSGLQLYDTVRTTAGIDLAAMAIDVAQRLHFGPEWTQVVVGGLLPSNALSWNQATNQWEQTDAFTAFATHHDAAFARSSARLDPTCPDLIPNSLAQHFHHSLIGNLYAKLAAAKTRYSDDQLQQYGFHYLKRNAGRPHEITYAALDMPAVTFGKVRLGPEDYPFDHFYLFQSVPLMSTDRNANPFLASILAIEDGHRVDSLPTPEELMAIFDKLSFAQEIPGLSALR